ncbi:hypothetical protein N7470_000050 [Penicillium chermesinum]|nr:hypothetical protein N7470_000050 [Penicillium chermesinum]
MRARSILRRLESPASVFSRPQIGPCGIRPQFPLPRPISTRPQPSESSSFWITITLLAIGGGACLHQSLSPSADPLPSSRPPQQEPFLGIIDTLRTMPIEPAPGTVGTLTPEQEAKLQEFWVLTLKVFGVNIETLEAEAKSSASNAAAAPPADKKKSAKRGWGLFRSTGDEKSETSSTSQASEITSGLASISITDGDDKYGQSKEFQQALEDMSPEEIRTAFWNMVKHDNPDALLLRFLRARKWDVKKALIMLISTMRWRLQDVHVDDDIMANGEALALKQSKSSDPTEKKKGDEFLHQLRMGKSFLHGVDRLGRPICVVRVRLHRASEQDPESLERFTVYTIETARLLLAPPVETATIIFDMTDFSLQNMDYTPVKFMIKCFEANYPESLGTVLIHKAPWVFSSIWSIIKGWLDPVVAAKIHFTKNREDLEAFIPPTALRRNSTGTRTGNTETRDKLLAERQALAKEIQDITIEWIRASFKKEPEAISAAKEKRQTLVEQLRKQYWVLDPYIRARSLYDRLNIVQGEGKIEFYPGADKADKADKA